MRYLELFERGGVMMWPIAICLLIALVIVVDRFIAFRRVDADPQKFLAHLGNLFRRRDTNAVLVFCGERHTMLSELVRESVPLQDGGEAAIRDCMERVGGEQTFLLERRLPFLAMVAVIAPLLGYLGTLLGMVAALRAVELHPAISGSGLLAGRIWTSIIPSAFGLAVGIPVFAFHLYFVARIRFANNLLSSYRPRVLELLSGPIAEEPVRAPHPDIKLPLRPSRVDDDEFFRRKTDVKTR